jgi:hypothetical protein
MVAESSMASLSSKSKKSHMNSNRRRRSTAICFMGSMPPGCSHDLYAQIYRQIVQPYHTSTTTTHDDDDNQIAVPTSGDSILCFIDSVAGLEPLLQQISNTTATDASASSSSSSSPTRIPPVVTTQTIFKVNVAELCRLTNVIVESATTNHDSNESDGVPIEYVVAAITKFWYDRQRHDMATCTPKVDDSIAAPNVIALTNGAHPAYLAILQRTRDDDDDDSDDDDEPVVVSDKNDETTMLSTTKQQKSLYYFDLYRIPIVSPFEALRDDDDPPGGKDPQQHAPDHSDIIITTTSTTKTTATATLYPIGAGDAVSAGTLAAWNYYWHGKNRNTNHDDDEGNDHDDDNTLLPSIIRAVLDKNNNRNNNNANHMDHAMLLSSFRFGLACGSASCLMEENSMVSIPHVIQLYEASSSTEHEVPTQHFI